MNKLKELRKQNKYTVQYMADNLGICKAYYSLIENGNRRLYYDLAFKIAHVLGVKPDDLFYLQYEKKFRENKKARHK